MVRITMDWDVTLKNAEVEAKVVEAIRLGLRDTIVAMHNDAVQLSPVKEGTNRRSICSEVSGMGVVAQGDGVPDKVVDDSALEAAMYSTSGYGGYLETGTAPHVITVKNAKVLTDGENFFGKSVNHPGMAAQPYFRPAFDMHSQELVPNINKYLDK
jgi:hypothetical protein